MKHGFELVLVALVAFLLFAAFIAGRANGMKHVSDGAACNERVCLVKGGRYLEGRCYEASGLREVKP